MVEPGEYLVTVTVAGTTLRQKLTVGRARPATGIATGAWER